MIKLINIGSESGGGEVQFRVDDTRTGESRGVINVSSAEYSEDDVFQVNSDSDDRGNSIEISRQEAAEVRGQLKKLFPEDKIPAGQAFFLAITNQHPIHSFGPH